ncbi:MAG TPA: MotA/TolQ/ExbB proton channel family protein [Hyphomonas sp.]|nr:biopolymer transporter ExbB [Hyphomonas sp.]HRI99645.1 MotA/TolQ/ExbB proton channel family protein [Hyphomonas sp.]HRK67337.1 MotA/TolQ/ExbB proton channel family protein [Hyphomonas sp.]
MKTFKSNLKALGAAVLFGSVSLAVSMPASAQSLSDVLNRVRQDANQMSTEDQARLRQFQQDRASQAASMQEARNVLAAAEGKARALSVEFDANEAQLGALEAQVSTLAGDFQELLGQFRSAAGATMPEIANSFANFDYTDRVAGIAEIAEARVLPNRGQLERLPKAMLQEMIAQSEVKTFTAPVNGLGEGGSIAEAELIRIGVFNAATVNGGRFVEVKRGERGESFLEVFKTQPSGPYSGAMTKLARASEGDVVKAPVDPSKGNLFGILGELPKLSDRLAQGGPVGMVIAFLAAVGILLGFYKMFTLFGTGNAMRATAKSRQAGTGNPLARVFEVYENNRNRDVETLELKLDEQILREAPRLERGIDIIKVLAAVAPLMGLLGTVIGMIITFTAITIYGAGDPKLMAGGISVALMTTVFGLVAAIPLLLIHAVVSAMCRTNQQLLDEQAAGLVAEKMESLHGGRA